MMDLPNETLTTIFNDLPPSTLAILSCVSFRFKAVAERVLYSSIHITDLLSESSPLPLKTLWWCDAMRRRGHLRETTRKLHVRWQADRTTHPPHYLVNSCERLGDIVRLLDCLESIDIFLGPANLIPRHELRSHPHTPPMHPIERVIRGCRFSHLRYCSLGAEWAKGVQPYTHTLLFFLASLTPLRQLRLSDLHSDSALVMEGLQPHALPHLSSFRGSADAAAAVMPGRPVQYLSLTGQDSDVNRDNLTRMRYTSLPLKCLDLSAMSIRPLLLRNISPYLPTIESLKVKLALRHTLHYAFSGIVSNSHLFVTSTFICSFFEQRILSGLSEALNDFHQLSFLDLSPTGIDGVGRADSLEELELCRVWSRGCPSLRRIIFPSQTEWALDSRHVWSQVENE